MSSSRNVSELTLVGIDSVALKKKVRDAHKKKEGYFKLGQILGNTDDFSSHSLSAGLR